jgi:GT2 family glycosyltransferase
VIYLQNDNGRMANVAIIIVTFNSSGLIQGVLRALELQTVKSRRVIIIDNGSEDVQATSSFVTAHPDIEWIPLPDNVGFAAANNLGIKHCSDVEFIALLNPDAFPHPEWLAELVLAAEANPEAGSFASRLLKYDNPRVLDGAGDLMPIHGKPQRRGYGVQADGEFLKRELVFCASAAASLYRRSALLEVGGFDEDYFCYLEDVDLGFRLRLAGYEAMYVPDAVVHHVGSATTGGQHSDFSVYHGHRNLVWTYVKNMPGWLFWTCLPLHVAMNLVAIVVFAWRGQGKVILRAKRDALLGLPKMWRKRREIQARRVASVGEIWRVLDKRLVPRR